MAEDLTSVFIVRMLTGLLGGILIGLERERAHIARRRGRGGSIPGMRTFGLMALYGSLSSYIGSVIIGPGTAGWFLVVSVIPILAFILLYAYTRMLKQRIMGITTYIVMLNTFLVGIMAGMGLILESVSIAVMVTLILAVKTPAERIAASINYRELLAILEVAALFLIIGPIISSISSIVKFIDLMKAYLFFTMVLALSLTSYIAARIWGQRGLVYSTMLGSLVNSEAMVGTITRTISSLGGESRRRLLVDLTPIIIGVMQARSAILIIAALYIFGGLDSLRAFPVILPLIAASTIVIYVFYRMSLKGEGMEVSVESPLSWGTAARSALAYILLTIASTVLAKSGVLETLLLLGFVGGLVNATATILSIASVLPTVGLCTVVKSMLLAVAAATLNKPLYADYQALKRSEELLIWRISLLMALIPLLPEVLASLKPC